MPGNAKPHGWQGRAAAQGENTVTQRAKSRKAAIWTVLLAAALSLAAIQPVQAQAARQQAPQIQPAANPSHDDILRGFDASALWAARDDVAFGGAYNPTGMIVKWQKPILYRVETPSARPDVAAFAVATLQRQAAIAGLEARAATAQETPNYTISFRSGGSFAADNRQAICAAGPSYNTSGLIQQASLQISLSAPSLERCIAHEVLHSFGLLNHPHRLNSILSYYTDATDLTEADKVMLLALYDPRIRPGMSRLAALSLVDGLIEEKRRLINPGAPPRTDAAPVLRNAIAELQVAANTGNTRAMLYLAEAAWKGYGMAPNPQQMQAMLARAAATNDLLARFDVAFALMNGTYVPKDEAQAFVLFQRNAEQGQAVSQNNIGVMLRDGRGVTPDPLAALTWFTIAVRNNYAVAERSRALLAAQLPPEQQELARARAAAWKPGQKIAR